MPLRRTTAAIVGSLYKRYMLTVDPHPLLDLRAFETLFPRPLGEMHSSPELLGLLSLTAAAPFQSDETIREAVRSMLRHGGFKPAGRSKPASEYLIKAVSDGKLPPINVAVDACNVVSLHSGLPISVVDLDLCLFDAEGPCGNAVKDAQRSKTGPETRHTLSLIWGCTALPGRAGQVEAWYRALLEKEGATTKSVGT